MCPKRFTIDWIRRIFSGGKDGWNSTRTNTSQPDSIKNQKITFVDSLECFWRSSEREKDVQINACVVHDTKNDEYFVFVTTDLK